MQNAKPQGIREALWGLGALLLIIGGAVVLLGFLDVSNAYGIYACGTSCNPPVAYNYPYLLLANGYGLIGEGFLLAFIGLVLLLIPRR